MKVCFAYEIALPSKRITYYLPQDGCNILERSSLAGDKN